MMLRHDDKQPTSLARLFEIAEKSLNDLTKCLSTKIQEAAGKQDFDAVAAFTRAAGMIASFAKGAVEEGEKLGLADDNPEGRTFLVRITEGALRNSYLSVTEGISRGWLKPGQSIQVELSGGREFTTSVMQANRLKERGLISEFYSAQRIKAGDYVELTETQRDVWLLAPVELRRDGRPMITGELLNERYKIGAGQARYRENGIWYHPLDTFPGALFDAGGYVLFRTESEYAACDKVKKGPDPKHIHVKGGISSLPFYVPLDPAPREMTA